MKDAEKKLLGRVANQFNLEYVIRHTDIFACQELGIAYTKKETSLPSGQHVHSSYEFLMLTNHPLIGAIEKKDYIMENNMIFPLNSEQYHGSKKRVHDFMSVCITMEKDYLSNISKTIFGKGDIVFENGNFKVSNDVRILMQLFTNECQYKQTGYQFISQSLAHSIAVTLIRGIKNNMSCSTEDKKYSDKYHIKQIVDYLNENYRSEYSLDDLSKIVNYSHYHLIRIFKSETGKTPYNYLMEIKVENAKKLLKNSKLSIFEVCYESGFNNPNHFSNVFKRYTGATPSEYRKAFDF